MSIQTLIAEDQPESFAFTKESEKEIKKAISKYPEGRQASAVKSLLYIAQKQNDNWIPVKAIEADCQPSGYGRNAGSGSCQLLFDVQSKACW